MKITINLLPLEVRQSNLADKKKIWIIRSSIGFLTLMVGIAAGLLSLLLFTSYQIKNESKLLDEAKTTVSSYQTQESLNVVLKNRLDNIEKITTAKNSQNTTFNFLIPLIPADIIITDFNISKENLVTLGAETNSADTLDTLFSRLTDPKAHEGKIAKVRMDSFTRSSTLLKFTLQITMTKKT